MSIEEIIDEIKKREPNAVIIMNITEEDLKIAVYGNKVDKKEVESAVIEWACHLQHESFKEQLPI